MALPDKEERANLDSMTTPGRWRTLALLSFAELLAMSLWFSASAVVPALRTEWNLSDASVSWLTIAVQLGFVCGTLLSAFLNLPDIINVRYLFAFCALQEQRQMRLSARMRMTLTRQSYCGS